LSPKCNPLRAEACDVSQHRPWVRVLSVIPSILASGFALPRGEHVFWRADCHIKNRALVSLPAPALAREFQYSMLDALKLFEQPYFLGG
jgi:hypothetical protein